MPSFFCLIIIAFSIVLAEVSIAQTTTRESLVPTRRYGYAYSDDAVILEFISPLQSSWGQLVDVQRTAKNERWTFDGKNAVTIVFLSIRENIVPGQSLLQIEKIWTIRKTGD